MSTLPALTLLIIGLPLKILKKRFSMGCKTHIQPINHIKLRSEVSWNLLTCCYQYYSELGMLCSDKYRSTFAFSSLLWTYYFEIYLKLLDHEPTINQLRPKVANTVLNLSQTSADWTHIIMVSFHVSRFIMVFPWRILKEYLGENILMIPWET